MARSIVITGASAGIGLAAAVELARRGEQVFATMRDTSKSGALLAQAQAADATVRVLPLDVTDVASIAAAVATVLQEAGRIDVVVNNAGAVDARPLEFSTDEDVLRVFDTNTFGPLRVIRAVLPAMRAQGAGRIVNLSSGASHGRAGARFLGVYAASKAALTALSEELLKEVAPLGIEVVLLDGVLLGVTRMVRDLQEAAAGFDAEGSPYGRIARVFQQQWQAPAGQPDGDIVAGPALAVADACQVIDPPFVFPPEGQAWLAPSLSMSDERFLRLARIDPAPELYEGVSRFWLANRAAFQDE